MKIFSGHEEALGEGRDASYLVDLDEPGVVNPTGGAAAEHQQVKQWREEIMSRLAGLDLSTQEGRQRHGLVLGRSIAEVIGPVKADAAHDGVWSYLSLRVFPDVVHARWPGERSQERVKLPVDRWIGGAGNRDRNYLKLAWRRWMVLGDIMETASPLLGEDEFGALLERSAVARNKPLVREVAKVILEYGPDQPGGRSKFAREFMKLVCMKTGSLYLDILSEDEIQDFVRGEAAGVVRSKGRRGVG
ncbi:DUF6339 family protein [Acidipropionibacterium acidipropionici]|uniref:DUF6339 family protein n=1 Tax=Acidipropionibacterium acidipropionici TaxID=1748 RepID=UPI00110AC547|nr:DUF6339 family protein [Acidipropionibacterium acidipropionici]QCV94185.1 hypothetical protein FEZ30_01910 [Acidipropionibacterium acidipropionici]